MDDDEFSAETLAKQRAAKAAADKQAREAEMAADPEYQAILAETKQVQKDTLVSTQNSVRTIKETITVADKTSITLKQQGEQLDRIDERAQAADVNATDSYQSARELHKYKGMLPVSVKNMFTGGRKREEDQRLQKTAKALDKEERKLEKTAASSSNPPDLEAAAKEQVQKGLVSQRDYGGDDVERQIDENLDEISKGLDHLQAQATNMKAELGRQNVTTQRIDATTQHTDYTLNSANRKVQEFL